MTPLRLAVISHSGVLEVNQALYAALAAAHPEVELRLIVPSRWYTSLAGGRWFTAEHPAPFVRPLPVRLPGRLQLHWYGPGLARELAAFRPDVLLAHEEPYTLVAGQAARLAHALGARLLLYTNQNLLRAYPPPFSAIRARVLRQAARMLVLSEACAEVLRGAGYHGPVDFLPYPFALPEPPAGAPDLAAQLGLARPLVGYVGRLEPQKGLLDLLQAAAILHGRGLTPGLLFVGDGPQRGELEAFAAEHLAPGQLKLTGYIPHDQVGPYFSGLDVFVLASRTTPTWKEQFGRVLLEAWGYGVPVVGSDSGHIPVLIQETGGGLIFREGNAEELAEKLGALLAHPELARELGTAAREVVRREYSLEAVAEKLYDSVRQAAEGSSR
jgi:glycosyltransferase involved in cell wall biosynthesis